jgi:hypothetical protein
MKIHYWQFLTDELGEPIEDAEIYVYLAGSSSYADIFLTETATSAINSYPGSSNVITTDSNGFFEFFIGDEWETQYGYESTQKFKVSWYKAGIANGDIDNISIFTSSITSVDETDDTDTSKNKSVSNSLAKGWEAKTDIYTETWELSGAIPSGGNSYKDITHSLNNSYPIVQMWDLSTNRQVSPTYFETLDANSLRIVMTPGDGSYKTVVVG